jgi:hypothetical protein
MLIVYKLLIDIKKDGEDEEFELPSDDISKGFQDGVYHLSTAPLTGFYDCLDGSSFSDISQENMIVKGGELSLAEDVKITIVSGNIIKHFLKNDIRLLGCRASMLAVIGDVEKSVFENMLVASCIQIDEASFEIVLADSAFANAASVNLKIPQGFGSGKQLETSYGEECLLKLYRQDKPNESMISQGGIDAESDNFAISPELEQTPPTGGYYLKPLITFDGRPTFIKNFTVDSVTNLNTGQPAKIIIPNDKALISTALEGEYIEICSGKGKGNSYRIVKVEPSKYRQAFYARFVVTA